MITKAERRIVAIVMAAMLSMQKIILIQSKVFKVESSMRQR